MTRGLTAARLEKIVPPTTGVKEISDKATPGLALRVTANDSRTWLVRTRIGVSKTPIRVTIGPAAIYKLDDARKRAAELVRMAREGIDPREVKREAAEAEALLFSTVADAFLKDHAAKLATGDEIGQTIAQYLTPAWRTKRLDKIRTRDIAAVLKTVGENAGVARQNRVLAVVRSIFSYAVRQGLIETVPIIKRLSGEQPRDRVLSWEEIARLWATFDEIGGDYSAAARLMLLTGQREGAVSFMLRSAIDTHRATWATERLENKNRVPCVVPLSPIALDVIASVPAGDVSDHVFHCDGGAGLSAWSSVKKRVQRVSGVYGWNWHDFRRTAATMMGDLGFSTEVVKLALNHSRVGIAGVTSVYDRSDRLDDMREALDALARLVALIVSDGEGWRRLDAHLHHGNGDADAMRERRQVFRRAIRADATWTEYLSRLIRGGKIPVMAGFQNH